MIRAPLTRVICALALGIVLVQGAAHAQPGRPRDLPRADTTDSTSHGVLRDDVDAQDSAYLRALKLPIRADQKLEVEIRADGKAMSEFLDSLGNTPEARMRENLTFTSADWQPTDDDFLRREIDIRRAQDFEYIFGRAPSLPQFSVSLASIGQALGLTEDVSPKIKYTVRATEYVTVTIYNLSAVIVKRMVDGVLGPGVYKLVWNMADESGKRVVLGDYIAEVIIGNKLALRKRIEVP